MNLLGLTAALESDLIWRRREILALTAMLAAATSEDEKLTLMRASLTLLYAHWEGFVKNAAQQYLNYVSENARKFSDLSDNFVWVMSKREMDLFMGTKKGSADHIAIMINVINRRKSLDKDLFRDRIDTGSNLKEKVFDNICAVIGLDVDKSKYDLDVICKRLLERRNKVAHGAFVEADLQKIERYRSAVLSAINEFTYDVLSLASTEAYLSQAERERRAGVLARRQARLARQEQAA